MYANSRRERARILELETAARPLDPDAAGRDRLMRAAHGYVQQFLNELGETPAYYHDKSAVAELRRLPAENGIEQLVARIDESGVGRLITEAVRLGRSTRPDLKIGICGEHGGDPDSIAFCEQAGLDYVSCSPLRVPVARLALVHGSRRIFGQDRGRFEVPEDFDAPLDEDLLRSFEGSE